jgi:hypothetical protein
VRDAENLFYLIANDLDATYGQVTTGRLFSVPCIRVQGKILAAFQFGGMAFKLFGRSHARALALPGAALWDPGSSKHPFREWVLVPFEHSEQWSELAADALEYVQALR